MSENKQLVRKNNGGGYNNVYPYSFTETVKDKKTGKSLEEILAGTNFLYLPYKGSKAATRLQVDERYRRKGLWIQYVTNLESVVVEYYNSDGVSDTKWADDKHWAPYNSAQFNPGTIGLNALSQEAKDYLLTNSPVNTEDITRDNQSRLQLADRAYNPASFSGKGYKILRQNILNGTNVLAQSMILAANTVYEIRYDYDLQGQEITIPEGCVLDFQGGKFSNGSIQFNNTIINSFNKSFVNIHVIGACANEKVYVEFYGAAGDGTIDDSTAIQNAIYYNRIVHFNGSNTYKITKTINIHGNNSIYGNGAQLVVYDFEESYIFKTVHDYTIYTTPFYFGDFSCRIMSGNEQIYFIYLANTHFVTLTNLKLWSCRGILELGSNSWCVTFSNCTFYSHHNSDNTNNYIGVKIPAINNGGERILFENCTFSGFHQVFNCEHASSIIINSCSIDYFDNLFTNETTSDSKASIFIDSSHIEAYTSETWFKSIAKSKPCLSISNSTLVFAGTLNEFNGYIFDWNGLLFLNNIYLGGSITLINDNYASPSTICFINNVENNDVDRIKFFNNNFCSDPDIQNGSIVDFKFGVHTNYQHEYLGESLPTIEEYDNYRCIKLYNNAIGFTGIYMDIPITCKYITVSFDYIKNGDDNKGIYVLFSSTKKNGLTSAAFSRNEIKTAPNWTSFRKSYPVKPNEENHKFYIINMGGPSHSFYIKNIKITPAF